MARYTESVCRLCRREGAKLFLKGTRCYTKKCSFERRPTPPGQHGVRRRKMGDFGIQLREKQKVRRTYGVLERQFRLNYQQAAASKGVTGEALLQILEGRLDSVCYRMGFGGSRTEARQLVRHNGILVNGKRVNIPSYQVRPGDVIEVAQGAKAQLRVKASAEAVASRGYPEWVEVDAAALKGTFKARPQRSELPSTINESLVVELYSK